MQAESAPNSDSTIRYSQEASSPEADQVRERLHDVGLRGDRVRRHDVRAAPGHGLGDRTRTLQLPKHRTHPSRVVAHDEVDELSSASLDVRLGDRSARAREPPADRTGDGFRRQQARDARDRTDQRGVRQRPSEQLAGQVVRGDGHPPLSQDRARGRP